MAHEASQQEALTGLLDYAEYLPCLIAKPTDETHTFRAILEEVGNRYRCSYIVQRFDEDVPPHW